MIPRQMIPRQILDLLNSCRNTRCTVLAHSSFVTNLSDICLAVRLCEGSVIGRENNYHAGFLDPIRF